MISQALSFMLLGSFGVALLVLAAACVPISDPMILGGDHLIWILWLVAPLLATSFLASPSDGLLMKRTPEKNDPKASQQANKCIPGTRTGTFFAFSPCGRSAFFLVLSNSKARGDDSQR